MADDSDATRPAPPSARTLTGKLNADGNISGVQQAGGDIHGITPAEHRRIVEGLLADRQRELESQRALMERAHAAEQSATRREIELLNGEIGQLREKLANPEASYIQDTQRAADIADRLDREANHLGAERIDAAKAALAQLDYSKAEALFEEVRATDELAVQRMSRAEYGLGEIAEARIDWHKAAQHYARAAELHADLETLHKAHEFCWRAGDYARALPLAERYVAMAEQDGPSERHAAALNEYALLLKTTGRYEEAEPLYRQALEIGKATIGEAHPDYATRLNNLAGLLQSTGRYDEAEPLYRQALEIGRATIGEAHPDYATRLNNLAVLYAYTERFEDAEPLIIEALRIREAALPPEHPDIAQSRENLAIIRAKLAD